MFKRLLIPTFLLTLSIFLLAPTDALACSCMAKPTVLGEFEDSELVVSTRLVSVEKIREKEEEYDIAYIRSATMIVTKVFKGKAKPGQALKFAQGGGADCIWTFDEEWVGDEFLFYLGRPTKGHPFIGDEENSSGDPMYHAVTCGRSTSLEAAIDDLAYLENINKVRGKTRFSGSFGAWWFNEDFSGADIKLKVVGKTKSYNLKADKKGFFEIYDLPPGEYTVAVTPPFGWKIDEYMLRHTSTGYEEYDPRGKPVGKNQIPIVIKKGKHTALDLTFDVDTAIKGAVLSPAGKPMKGVCVKAVSTTLKEGDYRGRSDCTNEKGEFTLEEMEPGNYIIVVNDDGLMSGSNPFGVVFYPGVTEFTNAGVTSVEAGRYVTGRVIQIPQAVDLITIKGRLLYSDGKPVADDWVKFTPEEKTRFDEMREQTDANGSFVFRLPKGAAGTLTADMYISAGQFKNCPKIDAMLKESGETFLNVDSSVAQVSGLEPSDMIEITFPFPSCEKAKE